MTLRLIINSLVILSLLAAPGRAAPATTLDVDGHGSGRAAVDWPREVPLRTDVWVVRDDWKTIDRQDALRDIAWNRDARFDYAMTGTFARDGNAVRLEQRGQGKTTRYRCAAVDRDAGITGIYWFAAVPVDRFAGGSVSVGDRAIALPATPPADRALGEAAADAVTIQSADGRATIRLTFDRPRVVRVQDARPYGDASFQVYVPLAEGELAAGASATLDVTCDVALAADASDVTVTLDASDVLGDFDGFGGNFVYAADDPATRVALDALRLTWARVPLELRDWEPTNDNGDAGLTNEAALAARDVPGSKLRRRFELDRELFARSGGRMIASVWYPPEWLFAEPLTGEAANWRDVAGTIPRDRWPELAECVVSYLRHLKHAYGVEPGLFSFNESDQGVYLKLDADETRDLTKLLGAAFERAGLKTRWLLGDSADLARGLEQIAPALADADARRFVGALAYHPWAGQHEHWAAWADLAERHGLPLYTTEMGAYADAWRGEAFRTPTYALHLARRYVEQLADARSRALLEWEWTGDYALTTRDAAGAHALSPRGQLLRQLTRRTPTFAKLVRATSDRPTVRAAAVAKPGGAFALHVVNLDAARRLNIRGLPAGTERVTVSQTDPETGSAPDRVIAVREGTCVLDLPAAATVTLGVE